MNQLDQNNMEFSSFQKQQKIILLVIVCLIALATTFLLISNMKQMSIHNKKIMVESAKITKERDLVNTVNNTIIRIDNHYHDLKTQKEQILASVISGMKQGHVARSGKCIERLEAKLLSIPMYLGTGVNAVVFSDAGKIVYSNNGREISDINEFITLNLQLHQAVAIDTFDLHGQLLVLWVDKEFVKGEVKKYVERSIHAMQYSEKQYVWVKEVLDFGGGDNYAIRRVHPNPMETEGQYLSTNTMDIRGNRPYQTELDGINEYGKITFEYFIKNPDNDKIEKKMAYAQLYEDFNWIVTTGIPISEMASYVTILEEYSTDYIVRLTIFTIMGSLFLLCISFYIIRKMGKEYDKKISQYLQDETQRQTKLEVAEKSSIAKSIFLANVSHEIRTPLNAILGLLYLILQNKMDDTQREYLTKIEVAAKALLHIVNDILDFSKIEAGKLEMKRSAFYLTDVLQTVTSLVSSLACEKKLELIVNVSPETPTSIMGDSVRLIQILSNLVNNAVKFTEKGQVTIWVEVVPEASAEVELLFKVQDTGIGLTPDQINDLFFIFNQADTSTTRRYGGNGLGLAICKRLVEMMKGTIWVESEYGNGSTFSFTAQFGLHCGDQKKPGQEPTTKGQKDQDILLVKDFIGTRILLAEDNEVNQLVARRILERAGLKVDIANNGRQAVDMAKTGQYELILMDIQMPEMDGLTATSEIRSCPEFENLPILAMTANAMIGDREVSIKAGLNDHISKPINVHEMFSVLAKWLKIARKLPVK